MTTQQRIDNLRAELNALEKELKSEKVEYPICKRSKSAGTIVLFDGRTSGTNLKSGKTQRYAEGEYGNGWIAHTATNYWEDYPYDKKRGLYHGQMVYMWENKWTHSVDCGFYNAINKCGFPYDGSLNGGKYDNYSATLPEFIKDAYETLEGIK